MKPVLLQAYNTELTKCCRSLLLWNCFTYLRGALISPPQEKQYLKCQSLGTEQLAHITATWEPSGYIQQQCSQGSPCNYELYSHLTPTPVTEPSIRHIHTPTHTTHHVATATDWTESSWLRKGWRWVWLDGWSLWWIWIEEILTRDTVELTRRVTSTTAKTHCPVLNIRNTLVFAI